MESDPWACAVAVQVGAGGTGTALTQAACALEAGRDVVLTLGARAAPDLGTVEALARLVLLARRSGARVLVEAPGPALQGLVELLGLTEALGLSASGQPER
ncbi:hypothetical protein [Motilibacter aurantiacus]|uniref:hypothetical protein n=1 Tax=Motilibacter aurantiacus TaxID=2714955 RepID=UPI00140D7DEB|nr:hypothetical protein [Motilibacter aurantiacus]NHC46926.1 hypothetical protein [Motilibacter aurantiacus]